MPTLKEYNVKLARLRSTCKLTRTMKLISANKLRRAQAGHRAAQDFAHRLTAMQTRLAADGGESAHPLQEPHRAVGALHCIVVTSDRGLCGGFNNNLCRKVWGWLDERGRAGQTVRFSFCGKRGQQFFRHVSENGVPYDGLSARPTSAGATRLAQAMASEFLAGHHDEVYLAYNRPAGALSQTPTIERLLPWPAAAGAAAPAAGGGVLTEPDAAGVRDLLARKLLATRIYEALTESLVAEHAARMRAMDSSSTNAENLIERYTLLRNRARQAAITRELIEIVAGAEALH